MTDVFGEFDDFEPLDSYAAFAAEPSQQNFWTGLTGLVQGAGTAYTTNRTATATARAQQLAQQQAALARQREAQARNKPNPLVIGGLLLGVGLLAYAMTRRGSR